MVRGAASPFAAKLAILVALSLTAWCCMTICHEVGHIVGGYLSGAKLRSAELRPWRIPYSLFEPDPHPWMTLWSGPVLGALAPLAVSRVVRDAWIQFIADFCVLANGCYLAVAWCSGDHLLDTARLLQAGTHPLWIFLYCSLTIGYGYPAFRRDCRLIFHS
jgi:hypothetical protein